MEINTKLFAIAIAVTSMALAPSLIIYQPADAVKLCRDYAKSNNWIAGCMDGWYDHDHCLAYKGGGSGDYSRGYAIGWEKGSC